MAAKKTQPSSNAARRKARLLADPVHGPRFRLLTKAKQDEVLNLRGTAARKRLAELDEARRAHNRSLAAARRQRTNARVIQHILDAHGFRANPSTVEYNVSLMTSAEKKRTLTMDALALATAARGATVQRNGRDYNPWWYH